MWSRFAAKPCRVLTVAALSLTLLIVGCEDEPPPATEATNPAAELQPITAPSVPEVAPEPPEAPIEIGWARLPVVPSPEARAANQAALRHHRGERFEQARDGFARAVELEPSFGTARFNLACALAKLGEVDAAADEVQGLLRRDLPRFGPRYDRDDDLAALRASERGATVATYRARVLRRFEEAIDGGVPLVHALALTAEEDPDSDEDMAFTERRYAQAGVWVEANRRFVPMAPRLREDTSSPGWYAVIATRFDPGTRRTLCGTARMAMSDLEDLGRIELAVYESPSGRELGRARPRGTIDQQIFSFDLAMTASGARWRTDDQSGHIGPAGEALPGGPSISSGIELRGVPNDDIEGVTLVGNRRLVFGEGEGAPRVELPRAHRPPTYGGRVHVTTGIARLDEDTLLVMSTSYESRGMDGTSFGPWALSRVHPTDGTAELIRRGEGAAGMRAGADEAIYVEMSGVVSRFASGQEESRLPPGLRL